jgi:hypothetical protein
MALVKLMYKDILENNQISLTLHVIQLSRDFKSLSQLMLAVLAINAAFVYASIILYAYYKNLKMYKEALDLQAMYERPDIRARIAKIRKQEEEADFAILSGYKDIVQAIFEAPQAGKDPDDDSQYIKEDLEFRNLIFNVSQCDVLKENGFKDGDQAIKTTGNSQDNRSTFSLDEDQRSSIRMSYFADGSFCDGFDAERYGFDDVGARRNLSENGA